MDYTQLTTTALIEHVGSDSSATERELALLDRLLGAVAEIDQLMQDLTRLRATEATDVDP